MTKKTVRVRFAPSPTGPLHVGGVRTALFNYLFARKNSGKFILRIEDTDSKRKVDGAEDYILKCLSWCGIDIDEGPYRQSERKDLYQKHVSLLIKKGNAYFAFDSEEELKELRSEHEKKGETFVYNWQNRGSLKNSLSMTAAEVEKKLQNDKKFVVRFKTPKNKIIKTCDIIRGATSIDSNLLDDKILIKADGTPTYHFANVVDDKEMKITHVIRGEEWLPSLALHTMLYDAFKWGAPSFAHLPLILNPNGKGKLSKRNSEKNGFPVFPLKWVGVENILGFEDVGILPEALVNYLVTLGWTPKEGEEVLKVEELKNLFSLEKVVSGGAKFDFEKLKWYNHKYIQKASNERLLKLLVGLSQTALRVDEKNLIKAIGLVKQRANTVKDLWMLSEYFFVAPNNYESKSVKKINKPGLSKVLTKMAYLAASKTTSKKSFVHEMKNWAEKNGISSGQIMMTIRVVVVGSLSGVDLQDIITFLGLESVEDRAKNAIQKIL